MEQQNHIIAETHGTKVFGKNGTCHCETCSKKRVAVQRFIDGFAMLPSDWIQELSNLDNCPIRLPMWSTLFMPHDATDERCIEKLFRRTKRDESCELLSSGWSRVSSTGFYGITFRDRVLLGIDGCGYCFLDEHWEPLYDQLGYLWHLSIAA